MMTYARAILTAFVVLAGSALAQSAANPVPRQSRENREYQRWNLQYEPTKYPTGGYEWRGHNVGGYDSTADWVGGYPFRKYRTGGYDSRLGSRTTRPYVGNPFVEDPPYQRPEMSQGGRERIQPPETGRRVRPNFWGYEHLRKTPPSGRTEDVQRSGN